MVENRNGGLGEFFQRMKFRLNRCMEPTLQCESRTIKAHSIPNALSLGLLEEKGHVMMMRPRFTTDGPSFTLESIGRNQASTFTGFCGLHDSELFQKVDTVAIDPENRTQLALMDFRTVTRELYIIWENAVRMQTAYTDAVNDGRDVPDISSPLGREATRCLLHAYAMYRYRHHFSLALTRADNNIVHDYFYIEHDHPVLAASAFFSYDPIINDNFTGVLLNIHPVGEARSVVVFSYLDTHRTLARAHLTAILNARDDNQKYQLSKLLLGRVENFALSPRHVRGWSAEKTSLLEGVFASTIDQSVDPETIRDDTALMLF